MSCLATRSAPLQMERGSKRRRALTISVLVLSVLPLLNCTSGSELDQRNKEIFDEAKDTQNVEFTTEQPAFTGATSISALITTINALPLSTGTDSAITNATIEGIVTMPASYGIGLGSGGSPPGCGPNLVYQRSFVLQDSSGGILVAYGFEPSVQDTAQSASMKYILNARNPSRAVFGDRVRLTVTHAVRYGSTTGEMPIVTDFTNVQVISSRNRVPYAVQTAQLARGADLYRMRQIEGYVINEPVYAECGSGQSRQFQYNFQQGYIGQLCLNAASATDATTCTGTKIPIKFQMSLYLGAGTLSGFDTGDMFSYKINKGAKVRMRGVVFASQYNAADVNLGTSSEGNLALMLGQRLQVETIP